ncbi:hypothetical protein M211_1222 [Acinetobacter lactucae]|nr:hypothetical protein M211_1222 [Acinetobacter lactucae]
MGIQRCFINRTMSDNKEFIDKLLDSEEDEKQGTHAKRGFRYQDWWCTYKTFETWASLNTNFAVGVEIKEDFTIIDCLESPTKIEFFQIKKNERPKLWSINDLIKSPQRKNKKEDSILSKLYSRWLKFMPLDTKMYFITNQKLKGKDVKNNDIEHFDSNLGCDLHPSEVNRITNALQRQLNLSSNEPVELNRIQFCISNMDVNEPDTHVIGKIYSLNEEAKFPIYLRNIGVAAKYLTNHFYQLSSNTNFAINIDQLKERCITRKGFEDIIHKIEDTHKTPEDYMNEGISTLSEEGYPYRSRKQIIKASTEVLLDLRNRNQQHSQNLFFEIDKFFSEQETMINKFDTLSNLINFVSERLFADRKYNFLTLEYIKCSVLIFEVSDGDIYCEQYFNL